MSFTSFPPFGFDRATGINPFPGTPTPSAARIANPNFFDPNNYMLEEIPESPEIERGEQATFRHTFKCDYKTGLTLSFGVPRGAWFVDSRGYTYKVLSTNLNYQRGDHALFIVTSESLSFDNPPDEFHVQTVELNPAVEKNPEFWDIAGNGVDINPYNLKSDGTIDVAGVLTGPQIIEICKQAANAVALSGSNDTLGQLNAFTIPDDDVLFIALNFLYPRYLKGETTFYLAGFRVVWSSYFFLPPLMDGGGYIQDPVTQGGLPPYFWSTTGMVGGDNILIKKAKMTNPNIYGKGLSWLRVADEVEYQRTWFRLTRTWIGGPLGQWDKDLYPSYP